MLEAYDNPSDDYTFKSITDKLTSPITDVRRSEGKIYFKYAYGVSDKYIVGSYEETKNIVLYKINLSESKSVKFKLETKTDIDTFAFLVECNNALLK